MVGARNAMSPTIRQDHRMALIQTPGAHRVWIGSVMSRQSQSTARGSAEEEGHHGADPETMEADRQKDHRAARAAGVQSS